MNLSASALTAWQRCKRKYALEREYKTVRWHPKTLLETVLRQAIFEMSAGADYKTVALEASNRILTEAGRSGLDTLNDPYTLAKDYCSMVHTITEALSRMVLLKLHVGDTLPLGDTEHCWKLSAFRDDSGLLHRWVLVEKWDDDAKYKEFHSWYTFGDCAAAKMGMTLHVIEIGRQSKGHQHTDWARAFRHPAIASRYRFRKIDGSPLEKSWIPKWFQERDLNDPKVWVDLMASDNVKLIHHIQIAEPKPEHLQQFYRDVEYESGLMAEAKEWEALPLSRPNCDMPYTCQWQPACYSAGNVPVEAIGGFVRL